MVRYFIGYIFKNDFLALLEYCSPVLSSAVESHLQFFHRGVSGAAFMLGGISPYDLGRLRIGSCHPCMVKYIFP